MTTPVEHGYPDYGRFQARADVILLNIAPTLNVDTDYGPFFVGGNTHIAFQIVVFGGTAALTFAYFGDEAGAVQPGTQIIEFQDQDTAMLAMPILGPWVTLKVDVVTAPFDILLAAWTAAGPGYGQALAGGSNVLISVDGTNVGAGATRTDDLTQVVPGEASFLADFPAGAVFTIKLYSVSANGTLKLLSYVDQNTPQGNRAVFLPPQHLRITSFNGDAAAKALFLSLTARPFDPGR